MRIFWRICNYIKKCKIDTISEKLQAVHGTQSFSRPGTPGDNSVMESFFTTLKKEELYRMNYRSFKDFETSLEKYILFYNEQRNAVVYLVVT